MAATKAGWILVLALCAGAAFAEEPPPAESDGKPDPAAEASETASSEIRAASEKDAGAEDEFEPPPGFVTKKRGKFVLYCKKDATIGTRFKTERCYNEDQIRDYLVALEEQKRDIDRIRSTCATGTVCAPN